MRTITQTLNMSPGGVPPVIHVSQYDSDFTITFTLFSLFGGFTIESGTTAQIRGTKSSGTGYSADAAINISAKTVTVTGNAQMTAAAGQNIFEIVLKKNNKEISSKNFILHVERAALDADTITDESVLKELNAIIEGAETATQAAEEANDAADRAEAAAQSLEIDPTPTQGSAHAVSSGGVYDTVRSADYEANLRNNESYVRMLSRLEKPIKQFAKAAYLISGASDLYEEASKMFNLVENKYCGYAGMAFTFPTIESSPVFGGLRISTATNNKRGGIVSNSSGDHPLKDSNGNATTYYPIAIPAGATIIYSNNNRELAVGINFHILKYDTTLNDYVRVWASSWHFCNIDNSGLYVFDISKYNDGTYFIVGACETASSEKYISNRNYESILVGYKTTANGTNLTITEENMKRVNLTIV